ncbi:cytochrome P450 [Periconia macrospinosa]|uniref:Cytochrome P450 n=1 Tax=Periconia macrospinosa TaxID=97972 RepID=A0A2V1DUP5_9PLEO|nr:cytochrome P450 [Periconia macrospinosa]
MYHLLRSPYALILLSPIIFLFLRLGQRAYVSKKQGIPGPFLARFSRLWYLHQIRKRTFHLSNIELHKKYGPVVRIAPNEFSIDDAEAVKIIYGHGTLFNKSPWYYAAGHPYNRDLFTEQDAKLHAEKRRTVASLYSMSTLLHMEPCVHECTSLLKDRLTEFATSRTVFNLQYWLQCYAFDVIGLITVAERFGFLDEGKDHYNLFPSLETYLKYCADVGVYSEIHPLLSQINTYRNQGRGHLGSFASKQIQKRQAALADVEKKPGIADDFLAKMFQKHYEDPETFTTERIFMTCLTNIGAGSDTTSISLCAIFWHLLHSHESLVKLRAEIESVGEVGSYQVALKLPYLQAVIKEALRLHPATGLPLGRVVPKGGSTIAGKYFSEGSVVGVNTWVAHHNTAVFGEDASSFRPERWLESEERAKEMSKSWLPFGSGSRTCIGKNISLLEISLLIPELVRNFDFELVDKHAPLESENIWFVRQKNVNCRVNMRSR